MKAEIAARLGKYPAKVIARDLGIMQYRVYQVAEELGMPVHIATPELFQKARAALEQAGFTSHQIDKLLRE